MTEMSTDRLEPASRVLEVRGQQPRRESGQGSKRHPPPSRSEREEEPAPEPKEHQIDSLA